VPYYTELPLQELPSCARQAAAPRQRAPCWPTERSIARAEDRVAWHAGRSHWRGHEALNATPLGVEIVNLHGDRHDYPPAQIAALIEPVAASSRHPHRAATWWATCIAPKRKIDPACAFLATLAAPARLYASWAGLRRRRAGGPAAPWLSAGPRRHD
jgi:N-acetylmuramoyl-L-alanine amidase